MAIIQAPSGGWELLVDTLLKKEQLAQAREEQKLRERDLRIREQDAAFNQGQMQSALQTLLMGVQQGDAFAQDFVRSNMQLGAALRDQQLSTEELQNPALLGATRNIGDARAAFDERVVGEFRHRIANASPPEARMLASQAPPQALAQADVRESLQRLEEQQTFAETSQRLLNSVEDPAHKEALAFLLEYQRTGASLTDADKEALFPQVFGSGIDKGVIDSIARLSILSGMPVGQVRLAYGVNESIPGLPDDFRFPVNLGTTQTERRQVIGMHAASMAYNANIINQIEAEEGGISLPGQVHRELMVSSAMSGGLLGVGAAVGDTFVNWLTGLDARQQEFVAAQFNWANSYRYMVSGQQTSDREFGIILRTTMANVGDTPQTIAQKRMFRDTMLQAAEAVSRGEISPVQSVMQIQQAAQGLNLQSADPNVQQDYNTIQSDLNNVLADMASDAAAQGAATATPLIPDTRSGDPALDLAGIRQFILGN